MRLHGREPLWSLTRHFINMSLHSDIGEAGGCCGAPAPAGALADQLLLRSWERCRGERLTTRSRRLPECRGGAGGADGSTDPCGTPQGVLSLLLNARSHVCKTDEAPSQSHCEGPLGGWASTQTSPVIFTKCCEEDGCAPCRGLLHPSSPVFYPK